MTARRGTCSEHSHAGALDFCRFNPAQALRRLFPRALVPRPRTVPIAASPFGIRPRRRNFAVTRARHPEAATNSLHQIAMPWSRRFYAIIALLCLPYIAAGFLAKIKKTVHQTLENR